METIAKLFLQNFKELTPKEREVLLKSVELENTPIFYSDSGKITRITP